MLSIIRMLIALALGLAAGIAIAISGNPRLLAFVSFVAPLGTLWMNALKMTAIPLVVSLIIVGIASAAESNLLARIGLRTLALFFALLILSALLAAVAAPLLFAHLPAAAAAHAGPSAAPALPTNPPTFGEWLVQLVPANPFNAASEGAILPLVIFCVLFAAAATRIPAERRRSLLAFFEAVRDVLLVLIRWIIVVAPIGVFALILDLASHAGAAIAGALAYFLAALSVVVSIQIGLLYLIAGAAGRASLPRFARSLLPAQMVAISSRSSLASLPALIEGAQEGMRLPSSISGLVLPLAVSTFKCNVPVSWIAGAVFLARLYGIDFDSSKIAMLAAMSVLMSFAAPGIPNGNLALRISVFLSFGLPPAGAALLVGIDFLPDLLATLVNVTADMTVAVVVSRLAHAPVSSAASGLPGTP